MQSRSVATAQIITGIAAAIALLHYLRNILVPFVVAFVLAVLVNALVRFIHRLSPKPPSWAVSAIAGVIVISVTSAGIFVIVQGVARMAAQGPALMSRLDALAVGAGQSLHLSHPLHLKAVIGEVSVPKLAGTVLSELQGFGSSLLLVIVYFGFIIAGRKRLSTKVHHASGSSEKARIVEGTIEKIVADIETYVWVQTITGAILTVAAVIVMAAVGLDNVLFWGVVFFLLTFIPSIGVTVGSVFPSLFALVQFPTAWQALLIFAVIQLVATVVGNLIYPRMQAETQNIDPLATLASLSFWSVLWGLPGAFLGVPMTLMLMMVFGQFEGTAWVAAMLSNDGRPQLRKHSGERPDAISAPD